MENYDVPGYIYLIHFEEKYHHAQHYIGWTENIDNRFKSHLKNNGSKLLKAVNKKGIKYKIIKTWEGTRFFERRMKKWKKAKIFCPICNENPSKHFDFLKNKTGE
jgi:predicted GIY-YIG superfamily endonuclease